MRRTPAWLLLVLSSAVVVPPVAADQIKSDTTWKKLRGKGLSLVIGRLEGRFDGPWYRSRKLRVRNKESGREFVFPAEKGRGYFQVALPTGTYALIAIEATYVPPIKPRRPLKDPPVRQRYAIRPLSDSGLPSFPVVTETPVYLGTLRLRVGSDGIVYEGHELQVVDEYEEALDHFRFKYPVLADSLSEEGLEPARYFFLRPTVPEPDLAVVSIEDPVRQARHYIADRKYRQAVEWLMTFMPTSDEERAQAQLLIGEALLADRKYPEAIEELGEVLQAEPENLRALRLLARAHAYSGDAEDALNLYQALAEALPDDAEAALHLGYHHALRSQPSLAAEAFTSAFSANFDYLLHDLGPYALALKVDGASYEPPEAIGGVVKPPSTLRSRRGSPGAFALLIDHKGAVIAAHLTPDADSWVPAMMMSVIRARFRPARLNGVPIPCLVIVGADDILDRVQ